MSDDLYQQVILEHNRKPRNFRRIDGPTHAAEGFNPLCGDHLWIELKLTPEGIIEDVAFQGQGCAISKASASMMTSALKGKSAAEARAVFEEFHVLVTGKDREREPKLLGSLAIFSGIWKFPARVKCAALAWHTMNGALDKQTSVSTE